MTEKTVINIDDVPLVDRVNGKQFAVQRGRVGPVVGLHFKPSLRHCGTPASRGMS